MTDEIKVPDAGTADKAKLTVAILVVIAGVAGYYVLAGRKGKSERKVYPGYVLVQREMDEETWHLVRDVPKVLGFIGGTPEKPAAITDKEANQILRRVEEGVDKPRPKVLFEPGEVVRVVDGPFNDFNGVVESVNYEKNRLHVAVQILGRSTPVELDFSQVEKA